MWRSEDPYLIIRGGPTGDWPSGGPGGGGETLWARRGPLILILILILFLNGQAAGDGDFNGQIGGRVHAASRP